MEIVVSFKHYKFYSLENFMMFAKYITGMRKAGESWVCIGLQKGHFDFQIRGNQRIHWKLTSLTLPRFIVKCFQPLTTSYKLKTLLRTNLLATCLSSLTGKLTGETLELLEGTHFMDFDGIPLSNKTTPSRFCLNRQKWNSHC